LSVSRDFLDSEFALQFNLYRYSAEHEMNCSTAAARHLASSGVDVYSAVGLLRNGCYGTVVTERLSQNGCHRTVVTERLLRNGCYGTDVTPRYQIGYTVRRVRSSLLTLS
jgi:hypothetical protein